MELDNTNFDSEYSDQELCVDEVTAYYLELDSLLDRVDESRTHYQVLGLDRLATGGEIRFAYLRAAAVLNPAQFGLSLSVPEDALDRVDLAFEKVSRAFAMLVSFQRRCEYDEALRHQGEYDRLYEASESAVDRRAARSKRAPLDDRARASDSADVVIANPPRLEAAVPRARGRDRRAFERFRLSVPVQVTGFERRRGKWKEATRTIDVSQSGVLIELGKRVRIGRILHLTLPMPAELRRHDYDEPAYAVYALVRRVEPATKGRRAVGLDLLGVQPPEGFDARPWAIFDIPKWTGVQRRRIPRDECIEPVKIEYLSEAMELLGQETSLTENISAKGLRVAVKAVPADFELVRVRCPQKRFECLASVSNRYLGVDGRERLCLRLLEHSWPV